MKPCFAFVHAALATALVISVSSANAQSSDYAGGDESLLVIEGFTEPYRDIEIGSPDTAAVAEVRVDEGAWVRFGQVIARLDDTVIRANVNIAREAAASTGELEAAKQGLSTNKRKYEQVLALHGRHHATDQELWNAQSAQDESASRVKAYEELASRRRLELVQAEAQLQRFTIRAPIDGIVVKKLKDVGEIVSPADPHLLRVVQIDPLRISATATLLQAGSMTIGQQLDVTIGKHSATATVEFVSPVADASSGTVLVQLRVPNPKHEISCGMMCEISLAPSGSEVRGSGKSVPRQTLLPYPLLDRTRR